MYNCWLDEKQVSKEVLGQAENLSIEIDEKFSKHRCVQTAVEELNKFYHTKELENKNIKINFVYTNDNQLKAEGYMITQTSESITIKSPTGEGILYGVFGLMSRLRRGTLGRKEIIDNPVNPIRMINHWDNMDGSVERGYAGQSIFYKDYQIIEDLERIKDYARLLASVGINSLTINNVNVHYQETKLICEPYLSGIARLAEVFRNYGLKVYLSINFAAPMQLGGLETADPLDERVRKWWQNVGKEVWRTVPDLGGFLVKADSENRPGPFTYGRTHADGANMLAQAIAPFDGKVIWRCFVYNCHVDWRDRKTDRAKAAYDHFKKLDGQFDDNVVLQIKNGPMDFQIREPISPLFGALEATNQIMEFQITQEYTGQQKHICYLAPMWKECLEFDTYAKGQGTLVKDIVKGETFKNIHGGIAGVCNIGDSQCWTGSPMAAVNLYGFGRLCWNPDLSAEKIAKEWINLTFGMDETVEEAVLEILLTSRKAYEDYTVPLGIGWMVNVSHHYGPNIEGYEYSPWGTYHYADYKGIGVDRTVKNGTGYTAQYHEPNASMYENKETCPEELLLFFHHIGYDEKLKDGRTLLQYIYDVHFAGVEQVQKYVKLWRNLEGKVSNAYYEKVSNELEVQLKDAIEWQDIVNTYFYRKTGIGDEKGRKIYP